MAGLVDINSLMQRSLYAANDRLRIQNAVANAPKAASMPNIVEPDDVLEKKVEDVKISAVTDILKQANQQMEALNNRALQIGEAMQAATKKVGAAK